MMFFSSETFSSRRHFDELLSLGIVMASPVDIPLCIFGTVYI
jgi:hypothetical protein